jgi:sarcosine oxidase gamma subunit
VTEQVITAPDSTLRTPDLTVEPAAPAGWLRISSRLPARQAAAAITGRLGQEPGPGVGDVRRLEAGGYLLSDGPGRWLLRFEPGISPLRDIPGCAVNDVSDSFMGMRILGGLALELLATGCPLDPAGLASTRPACSRSLFQHIPLLLVRLEAEVLDLYVPRSYTREFRHALMTGARAILDLHHAKGGEARRS